MRVPGVVIMVTMLASPVGAQWGYRDPNAPRLPDGTVNVKAAPPRTPAGIVDLSGIWQTDAKYNANLAADLKPGDVVMTPWAEALYRERQDNLKKDDPEGFCLAPGFPRVNGVPFPQKIIQLPDAIVILYETRTTFRQIFLDRHHTLPGDLQPTWMGYSRGRWAGDTLIVETKGFNDLTWLDDAGHPHSEQMKVTERIRRPSFGELLVEITIEDPKAYAKPWTLTQAFRLLADAELIEYVCNENNLAPPHLVGK
ncbi:MAG TPA: hypothetical protein VH701_03910 [Vicinamibacterales bacterium]